MVRCASCKKAGQRVYVEMGGFCFCDECIEAAASISLRRRQHGEVGGLRDQEWSLRVTQVFRRRGEEWEYVHRHADPLARSIGPEGASALALGSLNGAFCADPRCPGWVKFRRQPGPDPTSDSLPIPAIGLTAICRQVRT